jgi:hypothetical protein
VTSNSFDCANISHFHTGYFLLSICSGIKKKSQ